MKTKKIKIFLVFIVLIYGIIVFILRGYCATTLTQKSFTFDNRIYSIYTDCIKFHIKANGYEKVIKEEVPNNFYVYTEGPGRELQTGTAKMQGYGNYVFRPDTSLYSFIEYCYSLNPGMTIACCLYNGANELSSCDYTKLCSYNGQVLTNNTKTFVDYFWTNMTTFLGETFKEYQNLYYFEKYTNKGACLVFNPNKYSDEKGKEFLTAMTSYIFSTNQNSAPNCEIKKGDIIPFLYVKEQDEVDDNIKNSPKELAKYAYLACINGWSESASNDLWYEEYKAIFGDYDEEKLCEEIGESLEELEVWYMETFEKYQNERGKSGNALLGATIDTIIKSDYSIGQQVEAVDYYLKNIEGIGDYKENMARNELMAKYMMENSHIGDMIKDYNVGINFITENLQLGTQEDKNTRTCVLSDFQVLEFDHYLNVDGQSDEDGISDLKELTTNIKWVNITGPMQKYYNDMVSKGKTTKSYDEVIDELCKNQGKHEDAGGNIKWGHLKYEGGKVYYRTRDYDSNPMLNDTDFDGLQDNIDSKKTDGKFKGNATNIGNIEYVSDFRYFFVDNNKYNDELSTMSLMLSNLANGGTAPMHNGSISIDSYLQNLGFSIPVYRKSSFNLSEQERIDGKLYLAKKTIQIGANKKSVRRFKDVYGIFLGGFDTEYNFKKLVSNFDKEEVKEYYENIVDDVVRYIEENKPKTNNDYCYWVTGYSIAGGIAAEVAARLKEDGEVYCYTFGATNAGERVGANSEIKNIINEDDLYPKIYSKDEGFYRSGYLYNDSIFDNLQREYKKLTGVKYTNSKEESVSPKTSNTIVRYIKDVKENITIESLIDSWQEDLASYLYRPHILLLKEVGFIHFIQSHISDKLTEVLNSKMKSVEKAHGIRSYYVLSKKLNGFDLNNRDEGWTEFEEIEGSEREEEELTEEDEEYQERLNLLLECIAEVGRAYLDNVYTYQGAQESVWKNDYNLKTNGEPKDGIETRITDIDMTRDMPHVTEIISGQERVLKTSTVNAYNKWNEHKERIKDKYFPDLSFDDFKLKKIMPMVPYDDNKKSLHYLDIFDSYTGGKYKESIYNYDKDIIVFNDPNEDKDEKIDKGQYVCDDCSSFVSAVYWDYLNKLEDQKRLSDFSLWYTGSSHFVKTDGTKNILNILKENDFEIYKWKKESGDGDKYKGKYISDDKDFILKPGDLLYRSKGQNGAGAHVEFYLGDNHSFGWGEIHSSYENEKESKYFKIIRDLDIYNIGKPKKASEVPNGYTYRIENNLGGGIYNTIKRPTDYNCRYDYVIRLKKKTILNKEVD